MGFESEHGTTFPRFETDVFKVTGFVGLELETRGKPQTKTPHPIFLTISHHMLKLNRTAGHTCLSVKP